MRRIEMSHVFYETNVPPSGTDPGKALIVQVDENKCIGCDTCLGYCPTGAITFGDLKNPEHKVHQLSKSKNAFRLLEKLGLHPQVYYMKMFASGA